MRTALSLNAISECQEVFIVVTFTIRSFGPINEKLCDTPQGGFLKRRKGHSFMTESRPWRGRGDPLPVLVGPSARTSSADAVSPQWTYSYQPIATSNVLGVWHPTSPE